MISVHASSQQEFTVSYCSLQQARDTAVIRRKHTYLLARAGVVIQFEKIIRCG